MNFDKIYYEEDALNYELGQYLKNKFSNLEWEKITSHNNIKELREKNNSEFPKLKKLLIIGTRKTHKYVENKKVSDYLVPWTSSGCSASCLYCYLVCNYNKCSYLRLFVNREQMMTKLLKMANDNLTFEIGSNSDLILENEITNNLVWTIEKFASNEKGYITFPTKFDMIDDLKNAEHKGRTIIRMSVNPDIVISKIEFGTSKLLDRITAINLLCECGYKVGLLIAPIVLIENYEEAYISLFEILSDKLSDKAKKSLFIEVIFMTYSFVHRKINNEAYPNAVELYSEDLMTGRGMGKYCYRKNVRDKAELLIRERITKHFPNNNLIYIV